MDLDHQMKLYAEAHLKQLKNLSGDIQAQLNASVEVQRALWEPMRRALEDQWAELARPVSAQLDVTTARILAPVAAQVAEFRDAIQRTLAPALEEFKQAFRQLPPRIRVALLTLGSHGWYFDLDMPMEALWRLEGALEEGDVAGVEASLGEYFESELERIEASISARFPNRSHLIGAAFSAHRRGEYALSIPLLLAQTDGICMEVVKHSLFRKRDKKPQTAEYVEQMAADSVMSAFLSPLAQTLPINESEKEKAPGSIALNRHEVLHGVSLDYGTTTNGLKAVSLINYVACILGKGAKGA